MKRFYINEFGLIIKLFIGSIGPIIELIFWRKLNLLSEIYIINITKPLNILSITVAE